MHKILLAFLLFVVFFFLNSEVLAKTVPLCTDQSLTGASSQLSKDIGQCPDDTASTEYVCYKPTPETPGLGLAGRAPYTCYRLSAAAAGGTPAAPGAPVTPACTGSTCTSGGGQRCLVGPGTPDLAGKGILTAIGCVPTEPKEFVEGLLKYGTVAAGAIAFLLMLLGALGLITAEGNPETIKASQERFYSAIIGLLFIIFAVLLMQVIGVDILGLPGFN